MPKLMLKFNMQDSCSTSSRSTYSQSHRQSTKSGEGRVRGSTRPTFCPGPATSGGERGSCVPGNLCSATIKQMHFFIVYMHCNSATTTDCNCGTSGSGDIGLQVRQAQRTNVHRPVCEIELLESLLPHRLSDDSTAARLPGLRVGALDVDRSQHADAIRSTTQHDTD